MSLANRIADIRAVRVGLLPLIVFVASLALASLAAGQDEPLAEILVTGSRITRADFESMSPIVSVPREVFEQTGSTSVDTVMNRYPQFVPDFTSTSTIFRNGGQGNLQLRGLGTRDTLILVDGRRLIPANGTGVVDVNIIPSALIDSAEIITGGASTVYGSDAMAGVVNFKLKQGFDGLQFDGSYAQTERGDGEESGAGVTGGMRFAGGQGHLLGYVGYSERESIGFSAREFSRQSLFYTGPGPGGVGPDGGFLPVGSPAIEEGSAFIDLNPENAADRNAFNALLQSYGYEADTVPVQNLFGVNSDSTLFTLGDFTSGSVANYRGERDLLHDRAYGFESAPWGYLQTPLERVSAYGRANFEFDSGHDLYAEALYADYSVEMRFAPAPGDIPIPLTNPFIPDDLRTLLALRREPVPDEVSVNKRFTELGPRISTNEYDVYQLTAGLRGPLPDRWRYAAYVQRGDNDWTETQQGNALRSRVANLTRAPDGGASICGEFSLLGAGRMPAACIDYIRAPDGVNRQGYEQTVLELSADGPIVSLPAGEVRVALGVMHKRDDYFYSADANASDIIGFEAAADIAGSDYNTDLFVEALIPILAERPGVRRLDVALGYRHSEYQSAGGADSWKAELLYQPVEPLRLRGSMQRAVRAPSVFELYQPRLAAEYLANADFGFVDPCEATSAQRTGPNSEQVTAVEALCLSQGVPAKALTTFADRNGKHFGVGGGNPKLEPETADTLTLGFVLNSWSSSMWLTDMQVSVDWYRFEIENAVEYIFAPTYVPLCFDPRTNPDFSASNVWCGYFSRDPDSGEIEDFTDILVNIDGYEVSGADLQFDWAVPAGPGELGLNALVSWMDRFEVTPAPGLPKRDKVGRVGFDAAGFLIVDSGSSRPEWKGRVELRYAWGPLTLGSQWRYVDAMKDADTTLNYRVPSSDYFDAYAAYVFEQGQLTGLTLRAGVENLMDEDPPLLPSWLNANTDASQYDVLGRRYYLNVTYRF